MMGGSPDGLEATYSMGAMGRMPSQSGLAAGEFGGSLPTQFVHPQHQQGGFNGQQQQGFNGQQGGYGGQQGGYGGQQGGYGGQQGAYGGQQGGYGGQPRWSGGHRQQYGAPTPAGGDGRGAMHHSGRSSVGSAPAEGGMALAGARLQQQQGGGAAFPSAPVRAPSPAGGGGHKGYAGSFAALQQHPPQAFGSYASNAEGQSGGSEPSGHVSEEDEGEALACALKRCCEAPAWPTLLPAVRVCCTPPARCAQ